MENGKSRKGGRGQRSDCEAVWQNSLNKRKHLHLLFTMASRFGPGKGALEASGTKIMWTEGCSVS